MFDKLESIEKRYQELEQLLVQPDIATNPTQLQTLAQEQASLEDIVLKYRRYKDISRSIQDTQSMLDDGLESEMLQMVKEELEDLKETQSNVIEELKVALLPRDANENKNAIVEIRAGTGGEEATLFAADLFKMYCRYAELKAWKIETLSQNATGIGGFKEIIEGKYQGYNSILIGGETTLKLPENSGKGGRNQHYAAVSMLAMNSYPGHWLAASVGTDGSDYLPDVAGAMVDNNTPLTATSHGINAKAYIDRFDSNTLFKKIGRSLIITGNTGTNVSDVTLYLLMT